MPYWACLALLIATLIAVVILVARRLHSFRRAHHAFGVEPHAGLATARELRALRVRQPTPGRLTLGRIDGHLIATESQVSLAVIGPTGCGKTVGFAVPAILEWDGPVICTSVKTDLIRTTLRHRSSVGKAWVFDPSGITKGLGSTWSPLSACGDWGGAIRMAEALCEAAKPSQDTVTDRDYWYNQACKALGPHLHAAALSGRTMRDVGRWLDRQEQEAVRTALCRDAGVLAAVEEAIAGIDGDELRRQIEPRIRVQILESLRHVLRADPGRRAQLADQPVSAWPIEMQEQYDQRVAAEVEAKVRQAIEARVTAEARESGELDPLISIEALWMQEERLRGSVYATVQNVLTYYADPTVAAATASCDIDLDRWLSGPNTIYVAAPSFEQDRLRPIFTIMVQQAIRRAYETANANGGTLPVPCLVLLEEAGNVAPLHDLPAYAATARSHGISLVTVWQDLAQIRSIYDRRASTVLNNHRAKIFGREISDPETLEMISELVGDVEYVERTWSTDVSAGRRSMSERTELRPALTMDVIRRMPKGKALLVYGGELPALLDLRPWHLERGLRELGDHPPSGPPGHRAKKRQLPQNAEAA
ncbi:MAG: type IV secretory system conjugative DNA transfer family protein [Actinomycetota bacterium]